MNLARSKQESYGLVTELADRALQSDDPPARAAAANAARTLGSREGELHDELGA